MRFNSKNAWVTRFDAHPSKNNVALQEIHMITIQNLTHQYGNFTALCDINLQIEKNEIVALLGPNGAGKTTLIKILSTQLLPSMGNIVIQGQSATQNPYHVKNRLGYLPEHNPLYHDMLAYDALYYTASLQGVSAQQRENALVEAAKDCDITHILHKRISTLSKGLKQRLGLAQAIIHRPHLLILDEASSGLDPLQIIEMRKLITNFAKDRTVLLSTHILQEVQAIATRLVILHQGKITLDAKKSEFAKKLDPSLTDHQDFEAIFAFYTK